MIVIEDWRAPIVEMAIAKQDLAAWDPQGIFPNHPPGGAATEKSVRETERTLGVSLDPEHRRFLSYADGWKCFHQSVTLFATSELAAGPLRDSALEAFDYMPELLEDLGRAPEGLLPIAGSLEQADLFVMMIDNDTVKHPVLWLAEGEVIDTFTTFGQFFVSMIDYTKIQTGRTQEQDRNAGSSDQPERPDGKV